MHTNGLTYLVHLYLSNTFVDLLLWRLQIGEITRIIKYLCIVQVFPRNMSLYFAMTCIDSFYQSYLCLTFAIICDFDNFLDSLSCISHSLPPVTCNYNLLWVVFHMLVQTFNYFMRSVCCSCRKWWGFASLCWINQERSLNIAWKLLSLHMWYTFALFLYKKVQLFACWEITEFWWNLGNCITKLLFQHSCWKRIKKGRKAILRYISVLTTKVEALDCWNALFEP